MREYLIARKGVVVSLCLMILSSEVVCANEPTFDFDIPKQRADDALILLGEQADATVLFQYDLATQHDANRLQGEYTLPEAVGILLADSGLKAEFGQQGHLYISIDETQRGGDEVNVKKKAGLLASLVAAFTGGNAQEAIDDQAEKVEQPVLEEIVVIGSYIRGADSVSPVFVFDREAINNTGSATAQDFVRTIPQNLDFSESSSITGPASGLGGAGAGVNLRGLGESATLTLVNGRRLAAGGGGGEFVDISLIPLSSVERVEVMTDGASALYGADAVAGVVNFVLRENYDGAEASLRYGSVTNSDSEEFQFGQNVGRSWQNGNILAAYEFYHRTSLDANDREFTEGSPDPYELLPEHERHSIIVNGRQQLTDSASVFASGAYSTKRTRQTQNILVRGVQSGETDANQMGAHFGLELDIADEWTIEFVGGFSRNGTDQFTVTDGTPTFDVDTTFDLWTFDVLANGSILDIPGGSIGLAVGGQFRTEELDRTTINVSATGTILNLDRDVQALFGELSIPLIGEGNRRPGLHAVDLSLAARFEDFSDVGSSTNPKIGIRYSPVESFSIRGSYGTSFQAPRFLDMGLAQNVSALPGIFFPAPPGATEPNPAFISLTGGNLDLQPEESESWTAGFDYSPTFAPNISLSATYFDINFENRVDNGPSVLLLFTDPAAFGSALTFNPDSSEVAEYFADPRFVNPFGVQPGEIGLVADFRLQNIAITEMQGVDLSIAYSADTSVGKFSFDLNGSYLLDYVEQVSPSAKPNETINTVGNPIDWRYRASAGWSGKGFNSVIFLNFIDDYSSIQTGSEVKVDSWTTLDLLVSYETSADEGTFWHGSRFSLNVDNLLDEAPPFVDQTQLFDGINFDAVNADPIGRFISLNITKAW